MRSATEAPPLGTSKAIFVTGFALGYGIGTIFQEIWKYMGLKSLRREHARLVAAVFVSALTAAGVVMLGKMAKWQNSIHLLMEMDERAE